MAQAINALVETRERVRHLLNPKRVLVPPISSSRLRGEPEFMRHVDATLAVHELPQHELLGEDVLPQKLMLALVVPFEVGIQCGVAHRTVRHRVHDLLPGHKLLVEGRRIREIDDVCRLGSSELVLLATQIIGDVTRVEERIDIHGAPSLTPCLHSAYRRTWVEIDAHSPLSCRLSAGIEGKREGHVR